MVTHEDAIEKALVTQLIANDMFEGYEAKAMEAAICAYLDARDMSIVPNKATITMEANAVAKTQPYHDLNWFQQMPKDFFRLAWPHLLSASNSPFRED